MDVSGLRLSRLVSLSKRHHARCGINVRALFFTHRLVKRTLFCAAVVFSLRYCHAFPCVGTPLLSALPLMVIQVAFCPGLVGKVLVWVP